MSLSPLFFPSIKLINSLAWCLPTGFNTPITYFYLGFFVVLLLHRQMRDDEACREKYGKDWDKYCKLVPYKIIPYVVSWLISTFLIKLTV
jgi:protein-S-isoprenylcysteine O-methyltransferase Ste14